MKPTIDDVTIAAIAAQAADWAGLSAHNMPVDAIKRALQAELDRGTTLEQLRRRGIERDPALMSKIRDEVTVRETFFFRNPDQFDAIERFAGQLLAGGRAELRAWCAGCATGEEAYSLAATLLAVTRDPAKVHVLATDVQPQALEVGRQAVYRRASIRPSGPLLHPVIQTPARADGTARVLDEIRALVSFAEHDLRDAPPSPGHFDLILCRNVLVYFARPVAREVCAHLASALAPDGAIMFGAMDIDADDVPMLTRHGGAEHQMFRRRPDRREPVKTPPRPASEPPPRERERIDHTPQAVEAHRAALVLVERGRRQDADRALRDLNQRYPDYVPGLLERALFDARHGELAAASERMRAVLGAANALPPDHVIVGIEALPASFYATSAREFLRRHHGGEP